jgi:hypothetical protein
MKPVMRETYRGIVDTVGKETVTVIYEVDGSLIEQTYIRKQFLGGVLPKEGECIVAKILLCVHEPEPITPEEDKALEELDARTNKVRKPLTGPEEL